MIIHWLTTTLTTLLFHIHILRGMTQRVVRITVDARTDKSGGINQDSGRTTIKNSQLGVSWLLPGWQPTSEE